MHLFQLTKYACGKPFLYNPSQALSLVISSSSSTPPSNIIDLRKSKVQQLEKLESSDNSDNQSFFSDTTNNEVIPGIFQKKIAKIFAKLQLISSLSNPNGGNNNNDNGGDENEDNLDDVETDSDDNEETTESSVPVVTTTAANNNKEATTQNRFENLRQFRREFFPAEQLQEPPYIFPRVIGAIVNLAYRMISTPFNRNRDFEIAY